MKKILILLMVFLLSACGEGESFEREKPKTIYLLNEIIKHKGNNEYSSTFTYDKNYNLIEVESADRKYTLNDKFDANGNMISRNEFYAKNDNYEWTAVYDSKNRVTGMDFHVQNPFSYDDFSIEYEYKKGNNPVKKTEDHGNGALIVTEYEYDKHDNVTLETITDSFGNKAAIKYEYDKNNKPVKEITDIIKTGSYSAISHYTFEWKYWPNDGLVYLNGLCDGVDLFGYEYDEKGNLLREYLIDVDDGEKVEMSQTYSYDDRGNLVYKEYAYGETEEYEYDENSRLIAKTLKDAYLDSDYRFVYEYDENGNLAKCSVYNSADKLVSYNEYIYMEVTAIESSLTYSTDDIFKMYDLDPNIYL